MDRPAAPSLLLALLVAASAAPSQAQTRIPKAPGYDQCPLGYVNDLGTHCVSPVNYQVAPMFIQPEGQGCPLVGATW
jgi:hypothetical protein